MRMTGHFALILAAALAMALACDYATADEADNGDELGTGDEGVSAPPSKAAPSEAPATQRSGQQASGGRKRTFWQSQGMLIVMLGGMFLLFMWMGRSKRRKAAKRKEMLAALKKGDKITSIGGVVGTVIEVREDEITVKVDETNNSRLRFARWAIRGVGDEAKTEGPEERK